MPTLNPLKTLGLDRHATQDDVKKAYRQLAMRFHPDTGGALGNPRLFQEVHEAYEWCMTNHVPKVKKAKVEARHEKYFRIIDRLPAYIPFPFDVAEADAIVFVMLDTSTFLDGHWTSNSEEYKIVIKAGTKLPMKADVKGGSITAIYDPKCADPVTRK